MSKPSFGIYVHVPYCKSLCPYCEFNSYVQPDPPWRQLLESYQRELLARADLYQPATVRSVFLGGGTPSLAPGWVIAELLAFIHQHFDVLPGAEVTLEANPGTVDETKFRDFYQAGVNRISLGWQSTNDRLLRVLGRGHSAQDSRDAYSAAVAAGFRNISVDLIFAVPGQSMADLEQDLDHILTLNPQHVSLYALTYHEGTPFHKRRARGQLVAQSEDIELDMMRVIQQRLRGADYEHYEVSNYAKAGARAVHNSLYWQGAPYIGVGPGAHSFVHVQMQQGWRFEALRDPRRYLALWQISQTAGLPQADTVEWIETLTAQQLMSERMLCGLRTRDGVDMSEPCMQQAPPTWETAIQTALQRQWAVYQEHRLCPTDLGMEHGDSLASLFF